jgi:hypothetical protein
MSTPEFQSPARLELLLLGLLTEDMCPTNHEYVPRQDDEQYPSVCLALPITCNFTNMDVEGPYIAIPKREPNRNLTISINMDNSLKEIIWLQFGASIDMLKNAITLCPAEFWNTEKKFWYNAYHCLFF